MAATAARRTDFVITSAENLSWYEASDQARRGFCGRCGSTLFWDGKGRDYISIAAGSLDLPTGIHLAQHIFTEEKGDYYVIEDGVARSTGGEFSIPIPDNSPSTNTDETATRAMSGPRGPRPGE